MVIDKPIKEDLTAIKKILSQWTQKEEVEKYIERISNEIDSQTQYNMHFWVAREGKVAIGVVGLSDPLPKVLPFVKTEKPVEIKILYVDGNHQGKGVGRNLITFIEDEAKREGFSEIIVRSAKKYIGTAWGFYKKMKYSEAGVLEKDKETRMQVFQKLLN